VIPGASGQNAIVVSTYINDTNQTRVVMNVGATLYKSVASALPFQVQALYEHTKDTPFQYQAGIGIRVKQQGGTWSAWALKNDADGRLDAPIASTYQVGARNNANHFAGTYPGLLIGQHADPKAYLETLTSLYGT